MDQNNVRQHQIEEGRRQTLHVSPDTNRTPYEGEKYSAKPRFDRADKPKNKSGATGHEAFLKALVATGGLVRIKKATDGTIMKGVLKHTDRYTLTVEVKGYMDVGDSIDVVVYKHSIEEFCSLTPKSLEFAGV